MQTQERAVWTLATWPRVKILVMDWVTAQREDPVLQITLDWITDQNKENLMQLLSEHAGSEEGCMIFHTWHKLTIHQGALYQWHMSMGEIEEILQFVIPKVHQIAALNGCHRGAGHQGQQQMQFLLQDCSWWPGMVYQMKRMLKNYKRCIWHKGAQSKVSLHLIIVTAPLELLHIIIWA